MSKGAPAAQVPRPHALDLAAPRRDSVGSAHERSETMSMSQDHDDHHHDGGHDDGHHHEHGSSHKHGSDLSEMQLRVRALETVLTEKGYVDPATLDLIIEAY